MQGDISRSELWGSETVTPHQELVFPTMGAPLEQFQEALETAQTSEPTSEEELDRKVEQALACDCLADLRDGPCGKVFVEAFTCFVKSQTPERGMDCLGPFKMLQECMMEHPEEFADFIESKAEYEMNSRSQNSDSEPQDPGLNNSINGSGKNESEKVAQL